MPASLGFAHSNSAGLPHYKMLHSRILNIPLPYGMHLKVSHKGRPIFEQLCPQLGLITQHPFLAFVRVRCVK
jgi:hypothetical protein